MKYSINEGGDIFMQRDDMILIHEEKIQKHSDDIIGIKSELSQMKNDDMNLKLQLSQIEKNYAKMEILINDISKEQRQTLREFTDKILDTFTIQMNANNNTTNTNKVNNNKQLWINIGAIVTAITMIAIALFK